MIDMNEQEKRMVNDKSWLIEDVHGNVKFVGSQMDIVLQAAKLLEKDYQEFMSKNSEKELRQR